LALSIGLRMISAATMRRVTPWLVGLYVLALIGGIIPLVSTDSAHAGPLIVLSDSKAAGGELPGNHHHAGDADDAATHHALQDLTGILSLPDRGEAPVVHTAFTSAAARVLAETDAVRLERPPKAILSV
jgi:hypothetical protein